MGGVQLFQLYRAATRRPFPFTTKSPGVPGTHLIDLSRMEGCVNLGTIQWFSTQDPWIGIPVSLPLGH